MDKIDWDSLGSDEEALEYLRALPRYGNSKIKSAFRRAVFFLSLIYCRLFGIDKPLFVVLVTNNNCNLNCKYCYGNYGERGRQNNYSTRELLKIIDELKDLGTQLLTVHGGESLLRADIGEVVNYVKHKGFYIGFNTNGYLVPQRMAEIKCVDTICLSLDGTEESNDKYRGKGCYKKVMSAIDVIQANHVPCVISATLTSGNMGDMEFLAELGRQKGIKIQYSILYNSETMKDRCVEAVMRDEDIRRTVGKILELRGKGYPIYYSKNVLHATIDWPFSLDEKRYVTASDAVPDKKHTVVDCYHGSLKFQIDADGRVITCWAHDKKDAPNVKELGVAEAIRRCRAEDDCLYCSFLANNEHNALMSLSPANIWNIMRIQIADALKIKKTL